MKNTQKEQTAYPLPLRDTSSNQRACEFSETVCPVLRKEFQDNERVLEIQVRGAKENPPFASPLLQGGLETVNTSLVKGRGTACGGGINKAAFTLAEVLITLGVIGIVAAITLPSFIQNHQAKVRNEQNRMVQYKLTKATDQMKSLGLIGNYATTKDFVNELKKHFKIAQICENNNLEQCWPTKVVATDGTEVQIKDIKNGKSLNPTGWSKETIGIVTADGTPMIITYKDDCPALEAEKTYTWQTEDNKPVTNATTGCIAAIYDLNGKSSPNKSGVDVRLFNASTLGSSGFQCEDLYNIGVCMMTSDLSFQPLEYGSEDYIKFMQDNGIEPCPPESANICTPDYWGGAYKACKDAGGRLPTMAELLKVASIVYNDDTMTDPKGNYTNKTFDKNNKFNIPENVELWSSELTSNPDAAYPRYFGPSGFHTATYGRAATGPRVRCVK